jgi:hypothetical protein
MDASLPRWDIPRRETAPVEPPSQYQIAPKEQCHLSIKVTPGGFDITPWADRVQVIDATYGGRWELPVLGAVTAPTAVLMRPDGYVAWVGEGD